VINNRDTLVELLAKHTGNPFEKVAKVMERPFYMNPRKAVEFGVADKVGNSLSACRNLSVTTHYSKLHQQLELRHTFKTFIFF
jgi:ATP-dependent protease ClpP protease subunit